MKRIYDTSTSRTSRRQQISRKWKIGRQTLMNFHDPNPVGRRIAGTFVTGSHHVLIFLGHHRRQHLIPGRTDDCPCHVKKPHRSAAWRARNPDYLDLVSQPHFLCPLQGGLHRMDTPQTSLLPLVWPLASSEPANAPQPSAIAPPTASQKAANG